MCVWEPDVPTSIVNKRTNVASDEMFLVLSTSRAGSIFFCGGGQGGLGLELVSEGLGFRIALRVEVRHRG